MNPVRSCFVVFFVLGACVLAPSASGAESWRPVPTSCVRAAALSGCTVVADAAGLRNIAVAPDGRTAYGTAFNADTVLIFNRDPTTGALTQRAGTTGCMGENAAGGCTTARGIHNPDGVVVSQDGRSVYVAAWNYNGDKTAVNGSLAVFRRNPDTGALTFVQCFSSNGASGNVAGRCSVGRGMTGARDVTISPDQRTVYAGPNGTIATYDRDVTDTAARGNLTQLGGTAGCITSSNVVGCFDSAAIGKEGRQFTVSPDGRNVYAVGATAPASLVILDRNTGGGANHGALSQEPGTQSCFATTTLGGECTVMTRLAGASAALVSPDGNAGLCLDERRAGRVHAELDHHARLPQLRQRRRERRLRGRQARQRPLLPRDQPGRRGSGGHGRDRAEGPRDAQPQRRDGRPRSADRHERGLRVDHGRGLRRRCRDDGDRRLCRQQPRSQGDGHVNFACNNHLYGSSEDGGGAIVAVKRDFPPICPDRVIEVTRNTSVAVSFNCTDRNGDAMTYSTPHAPVKANLGAIDNCGGLVFYDPFGDYVGGDSFRFRAFASPQSSNVATAAITVVAPGAARRRRSRTRPGSTPTRTASSPARTATTPTPRSGRARSRSRATGSTRTATASRSRSRRSRPAWRASGTSRARGSR